MGQSSNDINRFLNAEQLYGNVFSRPIANYMVLCGFQSVEEDGPVYYKSISRLINASRTYKVVQL